MMAHQPGTRSRALLWHVFNRRIRALGYLRGARDLGASNVHGLSEQLCDPVEEELLFYVRRLTANPEPDVAELNRLARSILSDHRILHAIAGL